MYTCFCIFLFHIVYFNKLTKMRFFSWILIDIEHQLFCPMMETLKYQKKMNYQYYFLLIQATMTKYHNLFHHYNPHSKLFLICILCLLKIYKFLLSLWIVIINWLIGWLFGVLRRIDSGLPMYWRSLIDKSFVVWRPARELISHERWFSTE